MTDELAPFVEDVRRGFVTDAREAAVARPTAQPTADLSSRRELPQMARSLEQQGYRILVGPGAPVEAPSGKRGLDIVALKPGRELLVVDAKAHAASRAQDAEKVRTALARAMQHTIGDLARQPGSPERDRVLALLRDGRRSLKAGRTPPPGLTLLMTNSSRMSDAVHARLGRAGIGVGTIPPPKPAPAQPRPAIVVPRTRTQPPVTVRLPPIKLAPSPKGARVEGRLLALEALAGIIKYFGGKLEQMRVQEAIEFISPAIEQRQAEHPDHGIRIEVHSHQVAKHADSAIDPLPLFSHLRWSSGRTIDEARAALQDEPMLTPGLRPGYVAHVQVEWLPPLVRPRVDDIQRPFPVWGSGTFIVGRTILQEVEWLGHLGFNDVRQAPLALPPGREARFFILDPPATVEWISGAYRLTATLPVRTRKSGNDREVPAVDLDPLLRVLGADAVACPVFAADDFTDLLFETTRPTRDEGSQLRLHMNLGRVRWVRPTSIVVD